MELPNGFDLGEAPSDASESVQSSAIKVTAVMLHFFENCEVEISDDLYWKVSIPTDVVEGKVESLEQLGKAIIAGFLILSKQSLWRIAKLDNGITGTSD